MAKQLLEKPDAFCDVFTRKPGADQLNTTYCAGCGHGVIHKLMAEAVSDLEILDRTVLLAPVGCTVFNYYYFRCAAIQAAHGRAPAVLTGLGRVHPESVCISYQGDGDLAAIGTAETIHAANRGEAMLVLFVNNAIYGMTGGQMAPTSPIGMATMTSPQGRNAETEGHPIRMSEIIATLEAPVYVERVSVDTPANVMKARKAIRKGLQIQAERKGYAFVEVLSPCPTNWRVPPDKAGEWMKEHMFPIFPLGVFKDVSANAEPSTAAPKPPDSAEVLEFLSEGSAPAAAAQAKNPFTEAARFRFAGFGGQGILTLGAVLAHAGVAAGYQVSSLPSYGPEKRGGASNVAVILSPTPIDVPTTNRADVLMALSQPGLEAFLPQVQPGGIALYNESVGRTGKTPPEGVQWISLPATELAEQAGDARAATIVMLGAYQQIAQSFHPDILEFAVRKVFPKPKVSEINLKALAIGAEFVSGMA